MTTAQQQITKQINDGHIIIISYSRTGIGKKQKDTQLGMVDLTLCGLTIEERAKELQQTRYPAPQNDRQRQKNEEAQKRTNSLISKFDTKRFRTFKLIDTTEGYIVEGVC